MDLSLVATKLFITAQYRHTAPFGRISQGTLQQMSFRSLTGKSVIYSSCESGPVFWQETFEQHAFGPLLYTMSFLFIHIFLMRAKTYHFSRL